MEEVDVRVGPKVDCGGELANHWRLVVGFGELKQRSGIHMRDRARQIDPVVACAPGNDQIDVAVEGVCAELVNPPSLAVMVEIRRDIGHWELVKIPGSRPDMASNGYGEELRWGAGG